MNETPACPICNAQDWQVIGERTYRTSDTDCLDEYARARYRVLFEKWFPGYGKVTLTSRLCRDCGFITYTPRPEAADIHAKYRFLAEIAPRETPPGPENGIERKRARRLFRRLRGRLRVTSFEIRGTLSHDQAWVPDGAHGR
ncbi:MAG: hypothetical protein BECKG1743D_GA0114223_108871, partial [Candidatus Kentron sp. G]